MKAPKIKVTMMGISVFLFISIINISIEARDHEYRHEREPNKGYDEEVEVEHIIIKKKKYNDPSHEHKNHSHHHRVHRHLHPGYRTIRVIDKRYYYHDGVYYRRCRGGYEITSTPRIKHLPRRSRKIIVDHSTYFIYDNTYFQFRGDYYVVCEPPPPPPKKRYRGQDQNRNSTVRFNIGIDITN